MYFVDNESSVSVMPTPGAVIFATPRWFTEGDANKSPTWPGPDWFNIVQAEVLNVLDAAEIQPKKDDNTQLTQAIRAIVSAAVSEAAKGTVPEVGELYITKGATDPNTKWPGTTWTYLGEGLTLRTAKADGSDLGGIVGADTVTLTEGHLPAHAHAIGGTTGDSDPLAMETDEYDHGTLQTDAAGKHVHTWGTAVQKAGGSDRDVGCSPDNGYDTTSEAPDHVHNTYIGPHKHGATVPAHSHTLPAATAETGDGAALSVLQKSINVAVWERTA